MTNTALSNTFFFNDELKESIFNTISPFVFIKHAIRTFLPSDGNTIIPGSKFENGIKVPSAIATSVVGPKLQEPESVGSAIVARPRASTVTCTG